MISFLCFIQKKIIPLQARLLSKECKCLILNTLLFYVSKTIYYNEK